MFLFRHNFSSIFKFKIACQPFGYRRRFTCAVIINCPFTCLDKEKSHSATATIGTRAIVWMFFKSLLLSIIFCPNFNLICHINYNSYRTFKQPRVFFTLFYLLKICQYISLKKSHILNLFKLLKELIRQFVSNLKGKTSSSISLHLHTF